MRILILGATGMLGHTLLRVLAALPDCDTWGTLRGTVVPTKLAHEESSAHLIDNFDVEDNGALARAFSIAQPDVVINCIGLVKQLAGANDPLLVLPINSLLPHRLARHCATVDARLIHISTDCVFNGVKGNYVESDLSDAADLYGRSKFIGEVLGANTITLRTSIIGHELATAHSLLEWFLAQSGPVKGFTKAYFSGVPTVELATIIRDHVLPRPALNGLYHVAAARISKYDLLKQVAAIYQRVVEIIPDDSLVIDRSLNSNRFSEVTGYTAPTWSALIRKMHDFQ